MDTGHLRYDDVNGASRGSEGEPGIGVAAIALCAVTFAAWVNSNPLVLPLLSVILVVAALVVAAVVAWRHRGSGRGLIGRMHLAGLIMFFGFAASIMGDPDLAVKSLDALR